MNSYVKIVVSLIKNQLDSSNGFNLIKLENFPIPEIYSEVCFEIEKDAKMQGYDFTAKLSKEKYDFWISRLLNNDAVAFLDSSKYIEKSGNLTKWRNEVFNNDISEKTLILLMGTELVLDQGGIEDFFTINPEMIESVIKEDYSRFFDFPAQSQSVINDIYKSLFKYVDKDLVRLSKFAAKCYNSVDEESLIVEQILISLYFEWGIPNLITFIQSYGYVNTSKSINSVLKRAFNFSRRVGLDNLPSKKKYENLQLKLEKYYEKYEETINREFSILFPGYTDYNQVKQDILNYYRGIDIDAIRKKISVCDFISIDKMIGLNLPKAPVSNKPTKVFGDPVKALINNIVKLYSEISAIERESIKKIILEVDEIKLANIDITETEGLSMKWESISRLLNGIELVFSDLNIVGYQQELVEFEIISEDNKTDTFYPFDLHSLSKLIESGILKAASARDSISKLLFSIKFENDQESKVLKTVEFEWCIFDTDSWLQIFDIIDSPAIKSGIDIDTVSSYLPVGIAPHIGKLLESISMEEFANTYENMNINYIDLNDVKTKDLEINSKLRHLGKAFVEIIRQIRRNGFFRVLKDQNMKMIFLNYIETYNNLIVELSNKTTDSLLGPEIYSLTKVFTIINDKNELTHKGAEITVIPSHHPLMFEKIIERYTFLSSGLADILKTIEETPDITKKQIDKQFSRFEQLATITFATGATINENNSFENEKMTFGYTSIYGKSKLQTELNNLNTDYSKESDLIDNINGKLTETPISKYIANTVLSYLKVYPFKYDGLKVMFFNPQNYSDIIIAIKKIIEVAKECTPRFNFKLIVYTDDYRCRAYNYLKYWIDNNITEEDTINLEANVKFIDYNSKNFSQTLDEVLIVGDITFVENIMDDVEITSEITPEIIKNANFIKNGSTRYPATFLPIPKKDISRRFLVISQLQFECERKYTQLLSKIRSPFLQNEQFHLIRESKLKSEMSIIIRKLHDKFAWVVILDEAVDPELIRCEKNEIIGFSTGEGYFGELNATISSDVSILKDIEKFLSKRLKNRFSSWTNEEISIAARKSVQEAFKLDGAEVLKAINPNDEAVNNFLAFFLTSKIERDSVDDNEFYYRKLLSLDSYAHLFDNIFEENGLLQTRPDFVLLEISKQNNNFDASTKLNIQLRIIECKMGSNIFTRLDDAMEQVFRGNIQIGNIWGGNNTIKRRYWNNQLYKILSLQNDIQLNGDDLGLYTDKILQIIFGEYNINLNNSILTFSVDDDLDYCNSHIYKGIPIEHTNYGLNSIKKFMIDDDFANIIRIPKHKIFKTIEEQEQIPESASKKADNDKQDERKEVKRLAVIYPDNPNNFEKVSEYDENKVISSKLIYNEEFVNIFKSYGVSYTSEEEIDIKQKIAKLGHELQLRKIKIYVESYVFGPDIVRLQLKLAPGINIDQFSKYSEDMKLWLGINEKPYIYIKDGKVMMDIVRNNRQTIGLKAVFSEIIERGYLQNKKDHFFALLGSDIMGVPKLIDFSDSNTPHLLIAGQTGSGKSVLLNSMLISIMMFYTPSEVELILVDPKFIELTAFMDSPYTKVVATEAEQAMDLLEELVEEMNRRYKLFMMNKSKQLSSYNEKVKDDVKLKRIVMVFDEYAAMMEENKDISKRLETAIKVLSQKARAAGIHLIICTQSPRADIITTTIRNNLTARVGLRVADNTASSLILDCSGAENLLGKGDMLLKTAASSDLLRAKSPFVSEDEIEKFIDKIKGVLWT